MVSDTPCSDEKGSPYFTPHPHACLYSALRSPLRPESHPSTSSPRFADAERGVARWEEPVVARPLPCWLRPRRAPGAVAGRFLCVLCFVFFFFFF